MKNSQQVISVVHQSRWGFHNCSYETYLKLRTLKKYYYRAMSVYFAQKRWLAKDPSNRIGEMPTSSLLSIYTEIDRWGNSKLSDLGILEMFDSTKPNPLPVEVFSSREEEVIDSLFKKVVATGFEPVTRKFRGSSSATELRDQFKK